MGADVSEFFRKPLRPPSLWERFVEQVAVWSVTKSGKLAARRKDPHKAWHMVAVAKVADREPCKEKGCYGAFFKRQHESEKPHGG